MPYYAYRLTEAMKMTMEAKNNVVRSMLENLDHHHTGERAHASRVAVYATTTADALGITGDDLLTLRYAAELHDVGKVRVDAGLLSRMGQISDEEFAALRLHAQLALEVLDEYDFLRPCIDLIRHHHERYDGLGYPDGLQGEEIPLGSRIIGVAEAFDAMTFSPGWRSPVTETQALEELRVEAGHQFDPKVVEAFLQVQPIVQPVGL